MKAVKTVIRIFFFSFLILIVSVFAMIIVLKNNVSNNYKLKVFEELNIDSPIPVTAVLNNQEYKNTKVQKAGDKFEVDLKMFGVIPFSSTSVEIVDDKYVAVLGNPFGMKVYTDGVLVTKINGIKTKNGNKKPAQDAGIMVGDYIKSIDNITVSTNEEVAELIVGSKGKSMDIEIVRNSKNLKVSLKPELDNETGEYKAGLWVRDSSAGIGTLTFYSPVDNIICGLGHAVCDSDTEEIISLNSGEMVSAKILSYKKGLKGEPGELTGRFTYETICGNLKNKINGVYGDCCTNVTISTLTKVALKQEIEKGKAQILTTINGETPKLYSCSVKIKNYKSNTQNMTVTVTDKELLATTGGIIQGMSGSPVLQNGRLIGAITHVLVDDPTTGYAIFAENMLETAQSVANENKLKDAS
ncbi:MAG: SpoIVB peptidase [Clostridia bacterium]|nr:SpoIVB peptidase [Clostridia bacterium]